MLKVLRILVPVDFSKESDLALEWAVMVARKTSGATIYALHVLPLPGEPKTLGFGSVGYEMEQEAVEKKLNDLLRKIPGEILSMAILEKGRTPDVVTRICEQKDIDLVVMTTRGRRGLKHFLPESATEDTVRRAPCPVLVLHLNAKNQPAKAE